ncbi:MAG TPA: hypothetical protein VEQ11_03055 [Chloroflexota bacterium]|nr:hypothetical protein [Chloroflexota bacterium]
MVGVAGRVARKESIVDQQAPEGDVVHLESVAQGQQLLLEDIVHGWLGTRFFPRTGVDRAHQQDLAVA